MTPEAAKLRAESELNCRTSSLAFWLIVLVTDFLSVRSFSLSSLTVTSSSTLLETKSRMLLPALTTSLTISILFFMAAKSEDFMAVT